MVDIASCSASDIANAVNSSTVAIAALVAALTTAVVTIINAWRQATSKELREVKTDTQAIKEQNVSAEAKIDVVSTAVVSNPPNTTS